MSDQHQTPEGAPVTPAPPRRSALVAALPFIATAAAAILLSLLIQALLSSFFPATPASIGVATATLAPTLTAAPAGPGATAATSAPTSARPQADESVVRLEILDLEAADRRLWSAIYLLRAASQLDDSVAALQTNDLAEVDRSLLTARRSLDRAYAFSAEQEKGPIDTFRLQLSQIRDDLRLRPEGIDRRLRQLRQLILSLVDEGGT